MFLYWSFSALLTVFCTMKIFLYLSSRLSNGGSIVRSERMESRMVQLYNQRWFLFLINPILHYLLSWKYSLKAFAQFISRSLCSTYFKYLSRLIFFIEVCSVIRHLVALFLSMQGLKHVVKLFLSRKHGWDVAFF